MDSFLTQILLCRNPAFMQSFTHAVSIAIKRFLVNDDLEELAKACQLLQDLLSRANEWKVLQHITSSSTKTWTREIQSGMNVDFRSLRYRM